MSKTLPCLAATWSSVWPFESVCRHPRIYGNTKERGGAFAEKEKEKNQRTCLSDCSCEAFVLEAGQENFEILGLTHCHGSMESSLAVVLHFDYHLS